MGHEISQFDIQDRQLLAGNSQPRVSIMSDIGEAKITRTIFGRARIRVIREQDRKRRAWLLAVLAAIAIAAAAWLGWTLFQQMQYVAPHVPLSERIQVGAPVFRPARIAPDPYPSGRKSESLIQTEIDSMLSGPLPRRPPPVLKAAAKPVTAEPLMANKPQTTPVATINNASVNQTDKQQPLKPSAAIQPAAKTVATTPQPAANIPAAVVPLANPLVKGDSTLSSTGSQPENPVSAHD